VLLFVTVQVEGGSLAEAHQLASEIEERIRAELDVADVVVHTEP
jgi:divalent metal cation (Fe/Co/Zn/Cd) transporter